MRSKRTNCICCFLGINLDYNYSLCYVLKCIALHSIHSYFYVWLKMKTYLFIYYVLSTCSILMTFIELKSYTESILLKLRHPGVLHVYLNAKHV